MTTRVLRLIPVFAFLFATMALSPSTVTLSTALAQKSANEILGLRGSRSARGVRSATSRTPTQTVAAQQPAPDDTTLETIEDETILSEIEMLDYNLSTSRFWARTEYLLWWSKGMNAPPLVTTGPTTETGALGQAGTTIVFGDQALNQDVRSGGKISFGFFPWENPSRSIEVNYLGLAQERTSFSASNLAGMVLSRPFFNLQPATGDARQDSQFVATPADLNGTINIQADTDFQSGELLFRQLLIDRPDYSLNFLLGYRFTRLDDSLLISEDITVTGTGTGQTIGTTIDLYDLFDTTNDFHGANLGFAASYQQPGWSVDVLMKVAFGSTRSTITIDGQTTSTVPGSGAATSAGGLLAMPSNIGRYQEDHFTAIPELGATFRYQISPRVHATLGYSLIYWSKVARATEQIDFDLNPTQLPPGPFAGAPRPEYKFTTTDFWAQGINFGLECVF